MPIGEQITQHGLQFFGYPTVCEIIRRAVFFFTHLLFPSQETRHHDHLSRRRPLFAFHQESNTVDRVHLDIKDGDANVRV